MGWRYRCQQSLQNKRDQRAFVRGQGVIASLRAMAHAKQCERVYFDEAGFGPTPAVPYRWMPLGQTWRALPGAHRQRINVLGALRQDRSLVWRLHERRTTREDVIRKAAPVGTARDVSVLPAALQPGIEPDRNPLEASQVLLAPLRLLGG